MQKEDLLKEMTRTVNELRVFNEIGKALTSTLDVGEVLNIIMQNISKLLTPSNWSLLLVDEEKKELYFEIAVGEGSDKLQNLRLPIGKGVAGWTAENVKPLLVNDVLQDSRWCQHGDNLTKFSTRSIVCVPLVSKGAVLGVIELVNSKPNSFTESDLHLLESISDYAAIAIENARNFKRVQELTVTDDVTNLYNSRHLHEMLEMEYERSKRYDLTFSIIFFDLDHFKLVNDQHGHLCGSKLLKEVGELVQASLRSVDIPTRYGGDEFVIILPETNKDQALDVAVRLRNCLKTKEFMKSEQLNLRLSASFGLATYPTDTKDKDELLRLADEAMYDVKASTRDNIKIAQPIIAKANNSSNRKNKV